MLRLSARFPALRSEERVLHKRFAMWRTHGEWFEMREELVRAFSVLVLDRLKQ